METLYFQRIQRLQKEFKSFKNKKNKFNKLQKPMYKFINGTIREVIFEFEHTKIILKKGDKKKGFKHILLRHYCKGCDGEITAKDILNFGLICKKSIKLSKTGVTNKNLIVLKNTKTAHKIILKKIDKENFVVTFYSSY